MNREELEKAAVQSQEDPTPHMARGFFSGLFGRKRAEERSQEETPPVQAPSAYTPEETDYLGLLQLAMTGAETLEGENVEAHLLLEGNSFCAEQYTFLTRLQQEAQPLLEALTAQRIREETAALKAAENALPDSEAQAAQTELEQDLLPEEMESIQRASQPTPVDAQCEAAVSEDGMTAWAFLLPPLFEGKPADEALVRTSLRTAGICYGLEESQLSRLFDPPLYFKLVAVAHGAPPVNGKDGDVLDLIPRENKLTYLENEDGTVDYREVKRFNHIQVGDVICEISAPTAAIPGTDVYGMLVEGQPGKPPAIPGGKNTQINGDGTRLLSAIDGQVSFVGGKFQVDSVITISGSVDAAVGNLDVIGNVVITGDVLEGFTVKASGNIQISGIVEGAKLIAGGNVQLNRGMNGNMHGTIRAKGDVVAQFLENCTVNARGDVKVQSIINCTVCSDSTVDVTKGRGVIIGGMVTASKTLLAKTIGNSSHRATEIVMGSTPEFRDKLTKLSEEVNATQRELEEIDKSVAYLGRNDLTSAAQQERLGKLKLRRTGLNIQSLKKNQQYREMLQMFESMESCYIDSNIIFPGVRVTIGLDCRPVLETMHSCHLYTGQDGIVFGNK